MSLPSPSFFDRIRRLRLSVALVLLASLPAAALSTAIQAEPATISAVRVGDHDAWTRVVADLSAEVAVSIAILTNPHRVVLDMAGAQWAPGVPADSARQAGLVTGYRTGMPVPGTSRLVLEVGEAVRIRRRALLPGIDGTGYRLVLDLVAASGGAVPTPLAPRRRGSITASAQTGDSPVIPAPVPLAPRRRVVVLDAGHGGKDSGAIGNAGTREKNVALAFVRELESQLAQNPGWRVILTRQADQLVPLRRRVAVARDANADLFVSVHADALESDMASGLSVYTLSEVASDKEAAALAARENAADIVTDVNLGDETGDVRDILIDLLQRNTMNRSVDLALTLLESAGSVTPLVSRPHRFAGFRVLTAPDVPSVLVELGFLTNSADERNITSEAWRQRLAGQFSAAIRQFLAHQ